MGPVCCAITPEACGGPADVEALVERVGVLARAGVHVIQVRQPGMEGGPLLRLVRQCVAAIAATPARVVVNDRLDVALAAGAHGVHLRADSMPAARARALAPPGFLIGRSIHSRAGAVAAAAGGGLDYLLFGTVFPSASKPGRPPAGTSALAECVAAVALPVLAIGGVTIDRLPALRQAGAAGFAAIGLFAAPPLADLPALCTRIRTAFGVTG